MTQEDLAKETGIRASTISRWETGRTTPRLSELVKIVTVLRCTTDQILEPHFSKDDGVRAALLPIFARAMELAYHGSAEGVAEGLSGALRNLEEGHASSHRREANDADDAHETRQRETGSVLPQSRRPTPRGQAGRKR